MRLYRELFLALILILYYLTKHELFRKALIFYIVNIHVMYKSSSLEVGSLW